MRRVRGFTLLEVMIAFLWASLVLFALFETAGAITYRFVSMREGTYAHFVAANLMTDWRVRNSWPAPGTTQGSSEMAAQRWVWHAEVRATQDPAIREVRIEVFGADDRLATTYIGYLGRPGAG